MPESAPRPALYGRRVGRPLSPARRAALRALLPALSVPPEGPLDPAALLPGCADYALEIGFGAGERLAAQARARPGTGFLGAEPYLGGVSALLKALREDPAAPRNVRVHVGCGVDLARRLPPGCLAEVAVLNPDPWPKARHAKRRVISPENLDALARALRPGGRLVMTTDVDALAAWMVARAAAHPAFAWTARSRDDWRTPPPGWVPTRYETKGRAAGRAQTYLIFRRR
jgi:tRNA (guanine-N7-)-methyltransferase